MTEASPSFLARLRERARAIEKGPTRAFGAGHLVKNGPFVERFVGSIAVNMNDGADVELTPDRCDVECLHPEQVRPLLGRVVGLGEAEPLAGIFELLADPTRARLLHALSLSRELCVCDLALLLGRSESALSHQLRLLRDRRVVTRRKVGRVVYYRLADAHIRHVLTDGLRHVREVTPQTERRTG